MKLRTTPQWPRSARSTLRRLGRYLMRSAPMLALALILTLAGNVFALIGPTLCGYAIDATAAGRGGVRFDAVFYYACGPRRGPSDSSCPRRRTRRRSASRRPDSSRAPPSR